MSKDFVFDIYKHIRESVKDTDLESSIKDANKKQEDDINKKQVKKMGGKVKEAEEKPVVPEEKLEGKDEIVNKVAEPEIKTETEPVKDKEIDKEVKVESVPEGVVPVSPTVLSQETIQAIKEEDKVENVLGEFSDEQVAKDFAVAKKGSVSQNPETKKWIVVSMTESKVDDEKAEAVTKLATSLLRKIHKSIDVPSLEEIMDKIEKSATSGKISAEQETRLKDALNRRKEMLKNNPTPTEEEPTAKEEEDIEKDPTAPVEDGEIKEETIEEENKTISYEDAVNALKIAEELKEVAAAKSEEVILAYARNLFDFIKSICKEKRNAGNPIVKEEVVEEIKEPVKATVESKEIKEDVEVTLKTDDKETHIVSTDGGVQVTTLDTVPLAAITQGEVEAPVDSVPAKAEETPVEEPEVEEPAKEELPVESKNETVASTDVLKIIEHIKSKRAKKVSESSDDFTLGFAESVQKSLSTVLNVKVELSKVTNKLKTMDRIGLDALKTAVQTNDKNILNQFLAELVK